MTTKTDDWVHDATKEAADKAIAQRGINPAMRNAEQVVETKYGTAFVALDPSPCRHEFDQESEACTKCGMSIWSHAFRECP